MMQQQVVEPNTPKIQHLQAQLDQLKNELPYNVRNTIALTRYYQNAIAKYRAA